jgi:hypothetical protein
MRAARARRARLSSNNNRVSKMNKILVASGSVIVATVMLFGLSVGPAIDVVDYALISSLDQLNAVTAVSAVLTIYQVVLGGVFMLAVSISIRSKTGMEIAFVSLLLGWIIMFAASIAGMTFIRGFVLIWPAVFTAIPLFTIFILRDPAYFLILQAILLIISLNIIARGKLH